MRVLYLAPCGHLKKIGCWVISSAVIHPMEKISLDLSAKRPGIYRIIMGWTCKGRISVPKTTSGALYWSNLSIEGQLISKVPSYASFSSVESKTRYNIVGLRRSTWGTTELTLYAIRPLFMSQNNSEVVPQPLNSMQSGYMFPTTRPASWIAWISDNQLEHSDWSTGGLPLTARVICNAISLTWRLGRGHNSERVKTFESVVRWEGKLNTSHRFPQYSYSRLKEKLLWAACYYWARVGQHGGQSSQSTRWIVVLKPLYFFGNPWPSRRCPFKNPV